MTTKFKRDSRGLAAFMRSPGMQQAMTAVGADLLREAERRAPRGATGNYVASFHLDPGPIAVTTRFGSGTRAGVRIYNDSPHAAAVEFAQGHHVLGGLAGARKGKKGRKR